MSAVPTPYVIIPPGIPAEIADAIKAANPGHLVVQVIEPGKETAALLAVDQVGGHSRSSVVGWLGTIEAVLLGGLSLIPAVSSALPIVRTILDAGVGAIRSLLTAEPNVERWTLQRLQAARAAVPGPDDPPAEAVPAAGPQLAVARS